MIALDARFLLYDAETPLERIPRPAIRPYPVQYCSTATLKDGSFKVDTKNDYMTWKVTIALPLKWDDEACVEAYDM